MVQVEKFLRRLYLDYQSDYETVFGLRGWGLGFGVWGVMVYRGVRLDHAVLDCRVRVHENRL